MKKEEAVVMIRNTMDLLGQSFDQVWKENEDLFGRVLTKKEAMQKVFRILPEKEVERRN